MGTTTDRVLVIGGGVVGLACACRLQQAGLQVAVLERGEPGLEASFGNAGGFGMSEVIPLATPGVTWKVPGWLADPLGPLAIRWRHLPALLPWLWRFWLNANPAQVERASTALCALLGTAYDDSLPLLREAGVADDLRREGSITVYESEASWRAEAPQWELRRRHGIAWTKLDAGGIREREPDLAPVFHCAVHASDWGHVADPFAIADGLLRLFRSRQGRLLTGEAASFELGDGRASALVTRGGERHAFDQAVVAAGPWSSRLCRALGDRVLLESERGYHLTLPAAGVRLNNMVLSADRSFVMTPMRMGLRLAGTAEFAGLEAPPDYARADALANHARHLFGHIQTEGATRWMGQRPSTPDSLPVIGRSGRNPRIIYAFGHGHLGLTLAATTARIVTAIATGRDPGLDLRPFDIARFA